MGQDCKRKIGRLSTTTLLGAALGCCVYSDLAFSQTADSNVGFVLVTDELEELVPGTKFVPLRQDSFESSSLEWEGSQGPDATFRLIAAMKPQVKSGQTEQVEITAHSYGKSPERRLEVIQRVFRVEAGDRKQIAIRNCKFDEVNGARSFVSARDFSARFSGGCFPGANRSFHLIAYRDAQIGKYQACVEEGVKLAQQLDEAKINLTKSQTALGATQRELKIVTTKLTQVTSVVMPYLKKIAETLKDKNNFYIELRKEVNKVLAALQKS